MPLTKFVGLGVNKTNYFSYGGNHYYYNKTAVSELFTRGGFTKFIAWEYLSATFFFIQDDLVQSA